MTKFDQLNEVREIARERAVEDFEYFCNHVMGSGVDEKVCGAVQGALQKTLEPIDLTTFGLQSHKQQGLLNAILGWLIVLGRPASQSFTPSQTFTWLFGAELRRAA